MPPPHLYRRRAPEKDASFAFSHSTIHKSIAHIIHQHLCCNCGFSDSTTLHVSTANDEHV
jgi:hypothetical protein